MALHVLPCGILGMAGAREAVRKRWNKEAMHSAVTWSPDVVDVRAVDIDQMVRFSQDVRTIVELAQSYRSGEPETYVRLFTSNIVDRLERMAAVYFRV